MSKVFRQNTFHLLPNFKGFPDNLGDMCLFTSALRASGNKSHIPSLPQNNLYIFGKLGGKFETKFVTIFPRYLPFFYIEPIFSQLEQP
jgi:hypothetical protein